MVTQYELSVFARREVHSLFALVLNSVIHADFHEVTKIKYTIFWVLYDLAPHSM